MTECFVGRQPIVGADNEVYAYDLLYRSSLENRIGDTNRTVATSRVIVDTFVEIGIEAVVGQHRAFLNVDENFLLDPDLLSVPADRIVLQLPPTLTPDQNTVSAIERLKSLGYAMSLNGYVSNAPAAGLLDYMDVVKLDAVSADDTYLGQELASLGNRTTLVKVAKRVETTERRDQLAALGFDYFQGHFLAKPEIITGQRLPANRMAVLELVTKVCDPNIDSDELANLIAMDASLSVRVLRFVNSPLSGLTNEVDSIQHAAVLLGRNTLKSWVMLLAMAGLENSIPELITTAFIRAKLCEELANEVRVQGADSFFTVGLFSLMDAMMAAPMGVLLETLPFSEEVKSALTDHIGIRGQAICCAEQLERGAPDGVEFQDVPGPRIAELYRDAISWGDKTTAGIK